MVCRLRQPRGNRRVECGRVFGRKHVSRTCDNGKLGLRNGPGNGDMLRRGAPDVFTTDRDEHRTVNGREDRFDFWPIEQRPDLCGENRDPSVDAHRPKRVYDRLVIAVFRAEHRGEPAFNQRLSPVLHSQFLQRIMRGHEAGDRRISEQDAQDP